MKKGTIVGTLLGAAVGAVMVGKITGETIDKKQGKVDKFKSYYNMLNQWLIIKQEGGSLQDYFEKNNYNRIAIYGMGEMGNRLYDELKNSNITLAYAIDKDADSIYADLKVVSKEDELQEVDVIVVTATFAFDEIKEELEKKTNIPIISLEDIVYEC